MSNAQRAILRDMAGGAKLEARFYEPNTEDRHYLGDAQVSTDDVNTMYDGKLLRHRTNMRRGTVTYTLTPAGAEAAREEQQWNHPQKNAPA